MLWVNCLKRNACLRIRKKFLSLLFCRKCIPHTRDNGWWIQDNPHSSQQARMAFQYSENTQYLPTYRTHAVWCISERGRCWQSRESACPSMCSSCEQRLFQCHVHFGIGWESPGPSWGSDPGRRYFNIILDSGFSVHWRLSTEDWDHPPGHGYPGSLHDAAGRWSLPCM